MDDLIIRQAALDALDVLCQEHRYKIPGKIETYSQYNEAWQDALDRAEGAIFNLPPAQPEQRWIPFRQRPMTEEEKEMHPDIDSILDCKLPDDGQAILVTIEIDGRWWVNYDEYYEDGGSYLDSGYEICTEAKAWMPLPEPYGEEKHE